ncbi:hypothetical protein SLEP1_g28173 [Rubroshorea leprosula]|uniref:Uncharacterized protein n=1 Tax=Rubroshorea leprosula TaxID=152421 RepID=A0AAV5JSY2_9ROSI|nr:hypothetical protein SLEP1_g28173 [Rubroshorea leprosula]
MVMMNLLLLCRLLLWRSKSRSRSRIWCEGEPRICNS